MVQSVDMAVKANEILARFRPIAPKPSAPQPTQEPAAAAASRMLCLQSRPCRARKRGRPSLVPVSPPAPQPPAKRQGTAPHPPPGCAAATEAVATATKAHVSVPSTACLSLSSLSPTRASAGDLLRLSPKVAERGVPVERDLLQKLQGPKIIAPRAVRPVSSTIHVESIIRSTVDNFSAVLKKLEDVEAEMETDALPAVVSDSRNRVRLANDAYKEMVGQPECPWLDTVNTAIPGAAVSRRINGEVVMVVAESVSAPESCGGFSCTAKIEWECKGKWTSISALCEVSRVQCEYRDYLFTWRFRTAEAADGHRTA